ncbi:hypothetical protein BDQ12DRAFT_618677 [Crucibulum laeve]|uniref:Uncharacterized protein n=1 Tax=Crucibulum laeve TaxID=68775 RepID=A0A5C3LFT5_9AGAR|nr:hypothetical protein BDQ12DRAFT_618677 [Crucibulum laeve]
MLIKLLPPNPHSTVLFAFSFHDLAEDLTNPLSWTSQMNQLMRDELEVPKTMHSFDKAAGVTSLLEEVMFDLPSGKVSCKFVDGAMEEWPLRSAGCLVALENVLNDVYDATREDELERERELEIERERERERQRQERERERFERERRRGDKTIPLPTVMKMPRHKRQRSFFQTIVGSIVNLTSSRMGPSHLPSPPPTPITPTALRRSPTLSPRILRRRARSGLVDTYRLYVLSELSRRFPSGGYYIWIIESMLRRSTERMNMLVQQSGSQSPMVCVSPQVQEMKCFTPTTMTVPSLFSDDEADDDASGSTDTDGSSIHTPSLSHHISYRSTPSSSSADIRYQQHLSKCLESLQDCLTPVHFKEYKSLSQLRSRLYQMLIRANNEVTQAGVEARQRLDVLEIRSRRRAWSNKALAGAGVRHYGLAMPPRSSPLAKCMWTADKYEYAPDDVVQLPRERFELPVSPIRRAMDGPRLFPVCEEDEYEGDGDDEFGIHGFEDDDDYEGIIHDNMDLPDSCMYDEEESAGFPVTFEVERPQIRPRMRTASMYKPWPEYPSSNSPPKQLTSSSLLCQPVSFSAPQVSSRSITPEPRKGPIYTELDVSVGNIDVAVYGQHAGDEFTLAMDLPLKMHIHDQSVIRGRQSFNVGAFDPSAGHYVSS